MNIESELIIGASSAGLYTGIRLARAGIPVRIIERRDRRPPDPRLLIVTRELLRFVDLPDTVIRNWIQSYELNSPNQRIIIPLAHPDLIFDRKDFLLFLERWAERLGVEIIRARSFEGIFKDGKTWYAECRLNGSDRKIYFPFKRIIGADGAESRIAQCFDKSLRRVYLLQAYIALRQNEDRSLVRIWFDRRYTDYFVWLIPDGGNKAVCGLIHDDREGCRQGLFRFLSDHNLTPISFESGSATSYQPGFYPEASLDGAIAYLVGDAGAQVKMTTVGGTFTGLWGAHIVSRAITQGKKLKSYFGPLRMELDIHHCFRALLKRFSNRDFDLLLRISNDGIKRLLGRITRDQARRIVKNLLPANPLLSLLGYRFLIRSVRRRLRLL